MSGMVAVAIVVSWLRMPCMQNICCCTARNEADITLLTRCPLEATSLTWHHTISHAAQPKFDPMASVEWLEPTEPHFAMRRAIDIEARNFELLG